MTTRSRRRADANFEEPQAPDIHPMKVTLDNGDLTTRSHDSDFVKFLDLKKSYHKEFFEKVRKHALEGKYSLNTLQSDEAMRRECAYNFMDLYGDEHWGSPTNRRKYLDEKSLKNQNELAIYPDREDEIARAIMIFIQKKARRDWKTPEIEKTGVTPEPPEAPPKRKHSRSHSRPLRTSASNRVQGIVYKAGSKEHDTPRTRKKKDRARTNQPLPATAERQCSAEPKDESNSDLRPFSSIMREANGEAEEGDTEFVSVASSKRRKAAESGVEVERSEIFSDDHTESFTHSTPAVVIRNDLASFKALEEKYQNQTKFLVTASTQKEMAPVWIPYRSFGSASAFLGVMANECGVDEWDPSVQLNRDIGSWAATLGMASQFSVKAASITFDWTKFTIRVRLGKDSDLRVVKDGLEKAWMAKDKGEVDQPEEFHIGVMLHV